MSKIFHRTALALIAGIGIYGLIPQKEETSPVVQSTEEPLAPEQIMLKCDSPKFPSTRITGSLNISDLDYVFRQADDGKMKRVYTSNGCTMGSLSRKLSVACSKDISYQGFILEKYNNVARGHVISSLNYAQKSTLIFHEESTNNAHVLYISRNTHCTITPIDDKPETAKPKALKAG